VAPDATTTAPPADAAPKSPPKPASTLADEVRLIDAALAAVRNHRGARALELLDAYDRQYPTGAMAPEAAVARIDATRAVGDIAHARELATAFLAAHPGSPLAARVRALIAP
jgi:outer membrane protein assembly factor BamD (BamD/ComL family)